MTIRGDDLMKLALAHISIGYQIYLLSFGFRGYRLSGIGTDGEDAIVQALLIIGFILYTVSWVLLLIVCFGHLAGNKKAVIAVIVMMFITAGCIVVGIAIYGANAGSFANTIFTTYCLGAILALVGNVFLILPVCGVKI